MTQHEHRRFVDGCYRCDLSRDEVTCGAINPRLDIGRTCQEPTGHDGYHVVNDGCGRPEYYWPQP